MNRCPWCARAAMTLGQKASLGPGRAVPCGSCGRLVASHPTAVLAAIPAFLGGYAFLQVDSQVLGMAAVIAGLGAMALLHTFAVPLTRS